MWYKRNLLLFVTILTTINTSHGCEMDAVDNWFLSVTRSVLDTYTGSIFSSSTTNIQGISEVNFANVLNSGPYFTASYADSVFDISTNENFPNYEEYETVQSFSFTVVFTCTGGTTRALVFAISITDTNNNAPQFRPTDDYAFTITPPLPPGFQITGCNGNEIIVRDIDLTTHRIDFEIDENPYFEIAYDAASSTTPKEFNAILRTTTLIRTLPEPVELRISATDVDNTGDPPITRYATIRIEGDSDFQLPEEPIFSRAFYLASYTDHEVVLQEPISLRQGYNELVDFSLEGENSRHFELNIDGNRLLLDVREPLTAETLRTGQVVLVVRAEREFTSGTTSTVIIQLPEVVGLAFEQDLYEGTIIDNTLQLTPLVLNQGYEDGVTITLLNEHSSFFTTTIQGNRITLAMAALPANIINGNSFINLQVVASTDHSSATAIVTLEIVKDDNITPVFERPIYSGEYNTETGLNLEDIVLVQGYDESVTISLDGEHASYFQMSRDGPTVRISSATPLSPQILAEQQLLLSVTAVKPRTVGATAVVSISLPAARVLGFEESSYSGTLQNNNLILDAIILNVGFDEDVNFVLTGDYASSFTISNVQNQVALSLSTSTPLPDSAVSENNFLILTIRASGVHAITTSTTVLLEIVKQDVTTPVFSQNIYNGNYLSTSNIELENISLRQGFDASVTFRLEGENAQYFGISNTGNSVILSLESAIPETVIFSEKVLIFNILADKALTVGGNAAIAILFPPELTDPTVMKFSQNTYVGSLENDSLNLENIVLETGFAAGTQFYLTGEFASHFEFTATNNIISVSRLNTLTTDILEDNNIIVLEFEARRERAVSVSTSVIIDVIEQERVNPVFSEAFFRGIYTEETGLEFEEDISLAYGYDDTVTFGLEGEFATWFSITQNGNLVTLTLNSAIPEQIIENNNQLLFTVVAEKPETQTARAAISIDLPKEILDPLILRFTQSSYVGSIDNGELQTPTVSLLGENHPVLQLTATGEYASYFSLSLVSNAVRIEYTTELPTEVIDENEFILLDIEASYPDAISGYTTIVLELIKEPTLHIVTPVFEQAYYTGEYSEQDGLLFEHLIRLIQGFDETVTFTLAGDDARWFRLIYNDDNELSLEVIGTEIQQVEDRSHLIFSVIANKPSADGQAAIVISLSDFSTTRPLRFSQNYYTGVIENGNLTIGAMNLEEGFSADMSVFLTGDYVEYFQLTNQEGIFTLQLLSELPTEITDTKNILVFTLEVQIENTRNHATVIIELVKNEVIAMAFEESYYVGSYTEEGGLKFEQDITLTTGYDSTVEFILEGENTQWFRLTQNENVISITLSAAIPSEVIINNQHLIFVISAQRLGSTTARATIVIALVDENANPTVLNFERNNYIGKIENDRTNLESITLSEGYTQDVTFRLLGDLSTYFNLTSEGPMVSITLESAIPEESIPSNGIIVIELQASAPIAIDAYATVVFDVIQEVNNTLVELLFEETYYTGHYTAAQGLVFEDAIMLAEGYNENVQFALAGDDSQWFETVRMENSVSLVLASPIPPAVLVDNHQLIFIITAQKPGSTIARATIIIAIIDETAILGFNRISYTGSIENNVANIEPVILSEGYTAEVSFALHGELSNYFTLTSEGATVTLSLQRDIPEESLPTNRITILELQASAPQTISAFATIVLEIVQEDDDVEIEPAFAETFYTGHYTEVEGLVFENVISLIQGYDENIQFVLEGESSIWFGLITSGNTVSLTLTTPIPPAVLANNQQLVFVIRAQRTETIAARATIVIALRDEFTETAILGFNRISYSGFIENNVANIEPVILSEGYTAEVSFALHGELSSYFTLTSEGATVTLSLQRDIPEESLPTNRITILELQASAPQTISAFATIVFEIVQEDDDVEIEPAFAETFYTGHYTEVEGLVFENAISLIQGYDENIQFVLEGESSIWFGLITSGNTVSLTLTTPIPPAVLANNQQLVFVIRAQRTETIAARATIVIALRDEFTETAILGFNRISYSGFIENNVANIEPVILSEGYTAEVSFALHGELSSYFTLTSEGATVTLSLQRDIPEESLPTNRITILELQASAPQTISAFATIVFEIVQEDDDVEIEPAFAKTFYTGHYTEVEGLVFENAISLIQGYDENIQFALEGESSIWFGLITSSNTVSLTLTTPIPPAVLANNQQLVFVIRAQRTETIAARATIVIALRDEFTETAILGFNRISYSGFIENNVANIEPVILSEGYTAEVSFALHGELSSYFTLTSEGATVTLSLQRDIPEESLPTNRITILELQASAPQTISAFATIVFEIVQEDDDVEIEPAFAETFYTGHYTEVEGLVFENAISLIQGYDENIQFALEGESSIWFGLITSGNTVSLTLTTPIPPAVLANNQQLVFVIRAQRTETIAARATIVIALRDEFTETAILGFNRISYSGFIENNVANIEPVILSEGYTAEVSFALHGELSSYFTLTSEGATVTLSLQRDIPEESLPTNRITILELQASAPQTISAYATIVFEIVQEDDDVEIEPAFAETFYTGHYTEVEGLVFENAISLIQGYDENIQFALEGESSIWFGLITSSNTVSLTLTTPIPPAVLANNQQLVFVIRAQRTETIAARATIVIALRDEFTETAILGFNRISYSGFIENNVANIEPVILSEGYTAEVSFALHGELSSYFTLTSEGATVTLSLQRDIPEESLPTNRITILELQASAPQTISAFATIVFEIVQEDDDVEIAPAFAETFYTGHYTEVEGLVFENAISLIQGYDENIQFALEGESSIWFGLITSSNTVSLTLTTPIPLAVLANNQQLVFVIRAQRTETIAARATIVIALRDEFTETAILGFNRISYSGFIENNVANIEPVILSEGYTAEVSFALHGELSSYFTLTSEGATVTLSLQRDIFEESLPTNRITILELQASAPQTISAFATIVFEIVQEDDDVEIEPAFAETFYTGHYTEVEGLVFENAISLIQGYDETIQFVLEGESSIWFGLITSGNTVSLTLTTPIPPAVLANNQQLVFVIRAQRTETIAARATIVIALRDEFTETTILGFNRISYSGFIENNVANIEPVILSEGYTAEVSFALHGELSSYFTLTSEGAIVTLSLQRDIPEESLPTNRITILELQASAPQTISAFATIVFEIVKENSENLIFSESFYTGRHTEEGVLIFETPITLSEGFDENVQFTLDGDSSQWFSLLISGNSVILTLSTPISPEVLSNNQLLIFVIVAQRPGSTPARAPIVISLENDSHSGIAFERVLYGGLVQNGIVQHETITVSGFTGTTIEILGEYAALFVASISDGVVRVQGVASVTLSPDVTHVPLELRAGSAQAVLLLDIDHSDNPALPSVSFSSPSYALRVEISQTGLVGRVLATADNGEAVTYSLLIDNAHLLQRLSIDNEGGLHLSAPADSGVYNFEVVAATVFTQVTGSAAVLLTVDGTTVCGEDEPGISPLIILDRDEEEPHTNLVVLNATEFAGCRYTLTNRWPVDQNWLYVDESGLHANAIDREDPSIAFMALSQVQVELILECDRDNVASRAKRSFNTEPRLDWLGPYDYGNKTWILTDEIQYDSRRSLVNLIVNDINDNDPIFVGKENEPIVVGYPVSELEERVLPRALVELKATDADIGENAALVYWSSEDVLAVSRATGFVHVRHSSQLENDALLTVNVTDRNGETGANTGSITLLVKLIDASHIAVVTVRNAFLDDEETILADVSAAVGYEVKVLSSAVISDTETESSEVISRQKLEVTTSTGASLQLYVYGLVEQEPVEVGRLTEDINNSVITTVSIANTISLQDHLDSLEICVIPGRDTGLLVATIVLSVLLFILIVAVAVWFFLKWRKEQNYEQFSDANSLGSLNNVIAPIAKPGSVSKPRLNLEELKKSERRLQEMLDAPIEEISVKPTTSKKGAPTESVINIPIADPLTPIVIQSIDKLKDVDDSEDEDEFGERAKSRRKSVVTFNENVEKIIHVEDPPDDESIPEYEVYKL